MNSEHVRIWKEAIVAYLKALARNSPGIEHQESKLRIIFVIVHTCNKRLKCNTYFRLSYILFPHVSASLSHHQVYNLLLNLFHYHFSMSRVNELFLILKTLKFIKLRCIWLSVVGVFVAVVCGYQLPAELASSVCVRIILFF
jgi:hypothetical protein